MKKKWKKLWKKVYEWWLTTPQKAALGIDLHTIPALAESSADLRD